MKFVVDSNILFTYFWENSTTRTLIKNKELDLYAPDFALDEIKKYESEIKRKAKLTKEAFNSIRVDLAMQITFIYLDEYKEFLQQAAGLIEDANDIDFLALALQQECPLWSHDKGLKRQDKVKVLGTREVIELVLS